METEMMKEVFAELELPAKDKPGGGLHAMLQRVLASKHFARAPLLSDFLQYSFQRSLVEGNPHLPEQEIGVNVFHRRSGYDVREDNIVRSYARQIRKRLDEYYQAEGIHEELRFQLPRGRYALDVTPNGVPGPLLPDPSDEGAIPEAETVVLVDLPAPAESYSTWPRSIVLWIVLGVFVGFALGAVIAYKISQHPARSVWTTLFPVESRPLLIVPADTAFVTLEELNQRFYSLSEYTNWSGVVHTDQAVPDILINLENRRYTDLTTVEFLEKLQQDRSLPPSRVWLRSGHELSMEDLSKNDSVLLGSAYSVPWVQIFEKQLAFHFVYQPEKHRSWIEDRFSKDKEPRRYQTEESGQGEVTYAVVAFIPNLSKNGHALLVQGIDGAGTVAAQDYIFEPQGLAAFLKQHPDSVLKGQGFEILLTATAFDAHANNIKVLTYHLHSNSGRD